MKNNGIILWFTGLPAAGKTTIATLSYERLTKAGKGVSLLDGDMIRKIKKDIIGYSREDRISHIAAVGQSALEITKRGHICIVAVIAPYREARDAVLKEIGAIEIFVDAPLDVCKSRDPKGLYRRALCGEIKNFTGIDDPYEAPSSPDIHLRTDVESPEECTERVLDYLFGRGLLGLEEESQSHQPCICKKEASHSNPARKYD